MSTITATTNSQLATNFYRSTFIDFLKAQLQIVAQGQKQSIPLNSGLTLNAVRMSTPTATSTPLTEGTTPGSTNVTVNPISVTPREFGGFYEYSSRIAKTNPYSFVEQLSKMAGYWSGLSIDTIAQADLEAAFTTYVKYGGGLAQDGVAEASVSSALSVAGLRKVAQVLKSAGAMKYSDGTFHMVLDPHCMGDLLADNGVGSLTAINQYTADGAEALRNGAAGKIAGITLFESSNIQTGTGSGSVTVYRNFVFGMDAFSCVDVGSGSVEFINIAPSNRSNSDPLGQRGTTGWYTMFDAVVNNPAAAVEVYAASAL